MIEVGKKLGINEGLANLFIQRVRDNLHIVLCLSPVGEALRTRIRMFPSLVNCCSIDWFDTWPEEALLSISKRFLENIPEITEDDTKDALSNA
jgi:dynein heavy chain, axonemal